MLIDSRSSFTKNASSMCVSSILPTEGEITGKEKYILDVKDQVLELCGKFGIY